MAKTVTINDIEYYVYADLDDATNYNNAIVGSTWADKDEDTQKKYLVMATRKIDMYSYAGEKVDEEQPLKFPRKMRTGKVSDDDLITTLCCLIATFYNDNGTSDSATSDFINAVDKYQIGDLHVEFKDNATLDLSGLDDYIEKMLQDWLLNQGMEIWL